MTPTYRVAKSLVEFLALNPWKDNLNLIIEKRGDYTFVSFDDAISKNPSYDFLLSLPNTKYRGKAAGALWQWLHTSNLINNAKHLAGLQINLAPNEVDALYDYLEQQCVNLNRLACLKYLIEPDYPASGSSLASREQGPSMDKDCMYPKELVTCITRTINHLNDDIQVDLQGYLDTFTTHSGYEEMCVIKREFPLAHDYGFDKETRLYPIEEKHFRPLAFAGLWVATTKEGTVAPLRARIAMHDFRRPQCTTYQAAVDYFTDQVCLILGVEHLYLDATYQKWVERVGQRHPTNSDIYLVPAVDLVWEFCS